MSDSEELDSQPQSESSAAQDQIRQRSKRGSGRRGGRSPSEGGEPSRPGRPRIDRAIAGYGDGIERSMCIGVPSRPPRAFPVQHRTGLAVKSPVQVDRTDTAVLLCDGQHEGPHIWPNGDVVGDEETPVAPSPGTPTVEEA
jgi:hypothetical protein